MKNKKYIVLFLLGALLLGFNSSYASTLTYDSREGISVSTNGGTASFVGEFHFTPSLDLDIYSGYCIEYYKPIWMQGYYNNQYFDAKYTAEIPLSSLDSENQNINNLYQVAWLVEYSNPSDEVSKAGLQLAIWETILDGITDDSALAANGGSFYFDTNSLSYSYYITYMNALYNNYSLSSIIDKGYKIVKLTYGDTDIQDVIVKPVPEPATILLFGFGLLGLSALGKKKE